MNHLKRIFLCSLVLLMSSVNFVGISADEVDAVPTTERWRICSAKWSRADFGLPNNAPDVKVTVTWSYNFDTGIQRKITSVSNATITSVNLNGTLAQVQVYVGIWGYKSSSQRVGTCSYSDLPIGMEPFSMPNETQDY